MILDAASLRLGHGDRIGLIGPNGSGKTTLMRVIAGEQEIDDGKVIRANGVRVGWLPQDIAVEGGRALGDFILSPCPAGRRSTTSSPTSRPSWPSPDGDERRRDARAGRPGRRAARAHRSLRALVQRARGPAHPRRPRVLARRGDPRPRRAVGRLEDARGPRRPPVPAPRRPAPRRADQPPRPAVGGVVRRLPQEVAGLLHPHQPRPRVPQRADRPGGQLRARGPAQLPRRLRALRGPARRGGGDPGPARPRTWPASASA